jgi:hypothetical protein
MSRSAVLDLVNASALPVPFEATLAAWQAWLDSYLNPAPTGGPDPHPEWTARAAAGVVNRALTLQRYADAVGTAAEVRVANQTEIAQFADQLLAAAASPRQWPVTALLAAGTQFQRCATMLGDHPLRADLAGAAGRLFSAAGERYPHDAGDMYQISPATLVGMFGSEQFPPFTIPCGAELPPWFWDFYEPVPPVFAERARSVIDEAVSLQRLAGALDAGTGGKALDASLAEVSRWRCRVPASVDAVEPGGPSAQLVRSRRPVRRRRRRGAGWSARRR